MNIDIKSDRSERVKYNKAGLPIYMRSSNLSIYPNYCAEKHWHDDIEFIVIKSGRMCYNINSEIVMLNAGEGIFINARQFHFGFSQDCTECEFLCVLLHPILLSASQYIEQNFVTPVLNNTALPYQVLHDNIIWESNILEKIREMFEQSDLKSISLFYDIWDEMCKHKQNISPKTICKHSKLNLLKTMISFIQMNYCEKVSLSDISKSGAVGKTECCMIFQNYTNLTPIVYLNDYRLRKSVELLTSTDMTITEICYEVGFSGVSYFAESFKKTFHSTPKEYRKNAIK